jgi:hypothetical protein
LGTSRFQENELHNAKDESVMSAAVRFLAESRKTRPESIRYIHPIYANTVTYNQAHSPSKPQTHSYLSCEYHKKVSKESKTFNTMKLSFNVLAALSIASTAQETTTWTTVTAPDERPVGIDDVDFGRRKNKNKKKKNRYTTTTTEIPTTTEATTTTVYTTTSTTSTTTSTTSAPTTLTTSDAPTTTAVTTTASTGTTSVYNTGGYTTGPDDTTADTTTVAVVTTNGYTTNG